jgi:hypothetical protein
VCRDQAVFVSGKPPPVESAVLINVWKNDLSGVWAHAFGKQTKGENVFATSSSSSNDWVFAVEHVLVQSYKSGNASFGFRVKTDPKPVVSKETNPRIVFNYNVTAPLHQVLKPGDTRELAQRAGLRFRVDGQLKLDYVAGKDIIGGFEYDLEWDRQSELSWEFVVPEYNPSSTYFARIDVRFHPLTFRLPFYITRQSCLFQPTNTPSAPTPPSRSCSLSSSRSSPLALASTNA